MSELENLNHNGLWECREAGNKDVRIEFGVFRGNLGLSIFDKTKGGAPVWRTNVPRDMANLIRRMYTHLLTQDPGTKYPVSVEEWDNQARKANTVATLIFGLDTKANPFLGVTCPAGTFKFVIRMGLKYNVEGSGIPEGMIKAAAVDAMANALVDDAEIAIRLSKQKGQRPGQGGGSNGGGNRGGSSGGYSTSGGGNSGGGGGSSSGGASDDYSFL